MKKEGRKHVDWNLFLNSGHSNLKKNRSNKYLASLRPSRISKKSRTNHNQRIM